MEGSSANGSNSCDHIYPSYHRGADGHHRSATNDTVETKVRNHRSTSLPVTAEDYDHPAESSLPTSRPGGSSKTVHNSGQTVTDGDASVPEIQSAANEMPNCDYSDLSTRTVGNIQRVDVDETGVSGINSCEEIKTKLLSEYDVHLRRPRDNLLDRSADVVPYESRWQNFDSDRASDGNGGHPVCSPHQSPLVHNNSRFQAVNEFPSLLPFGGKESHCDTGRAQGSESVVKRKRRVSEARSALYRRLLSSEAAGSSDVDMSCDVFESLSSDEEDDDDSDVSNVNMDSSSDRSCLVIVSTF